ncbi:MAG TPA: transglutaminase-like domain-containing protein [Thermoanaerobaculia bacterium]|nr:transglutaminase-like domain-containing protein [Thermoanaerobaculia bacterium]
MRVRTLLLALLSACAVRAVGQVAPASGEWALYRLDGPAPWRYARAVEGAGYRVVLSSPDGKGLEARVEVSAAPLTADAPFPPAPSILSAEAREALADPLADDPELDALAGTLLTGTKTTLEAVERVVAFTAHQVRYALPDGSPENASETLRARRGSCVGRSLLAAELLLRAGVPARQVTGVLAAQRARELTPESRAVFNAALGGVRHRWIEVFVPGVGWVPSDPSGLANTVTAKHLALARQPPAGFHVEVAGRSAELKRPVLETGEGGLTLYRPRGASIVEAVEGAPLDPRALAAPPPARR